MGAPKGACRLGKGLAAVAVLLAGGWALLRHQGAPLPPPDDMTALRDAPRNDAADFGTLHQAIKEQIQRSREERVKAVEQGPASAAARSANASDYEMMRSWGISDEGLLWFTEKLDGFAVPPIDGRKLYLQRPPTAPLPHVPSIFEQVEAEARRYEATVEGMRDRERIRRFISADLQAEEADRQEFADRLEDLAAVFTVAALALSKKDTPLEPHHLYWGLIGRESRRLKHCHGGPLARQVDRLLHSKFVEKAGRVIMWDDVFNHSLPLAFGAGKNDDSPYHVLNTIIWSELGKHGVRYPLKN
ncbi:MAG: hypothetical protein HY927_03825 [Elusimicrobia bacterium]|nr:hypothetical protein [Elusimicrobiota bacterium]